MERPPEQLVAGGLALLLLLLYVRVVLLSTQKWFHAILVMLVVFLGI
jgi:hypothetical protein